MKKTRLLTTVLAVGIMVVCMCGMVFGYEHDTTLLANKTIGSTEVYANSAFYQSVKKYCSLQPYYKSIINDGKYVLNLYIKQNSKRTYYDYDDKAIKAKSTAGFYSSRIMLEAGYNYEPSLKCTGGAIMNLNYLEVNFD